jgi:hypothetical protein
MFHSFQKSFSGDRNEFADFQITPNYFQLQPIQPIKSTALSHKDSSSEHDSDDACKIVGLAHGGASNQDEIDVASDDSAGEVFQKLVKSHTP